MTTEALLTHDHADACKNCGTATRGNYCHQCGQAAHVHVPSAREFLHEFLGHYVALEGKLWKSLALLLFKPGFLSREYIEGRRVRYLEPLRLYLTFSIIFFALVKFSGVELFETDAFATPPAHSAPAAERKAGTELGVVTAGQSETFDEFRLRMVRWAAAIDPVFGSKLDRFTSQPVPVQQDAIKRAFFGYAPYAIFALMPVFAGYLKLLYLGSGRRYGEHFLFALHTNAFAFFMLSVLVLLPKDWDFIRFVLNVWLAFYLPTAMRRVYGGRRLTTGLRWLALMTLHLLSIVLAIVLVVGQALLA
ncbi:MAG: DUF3667 domain-containing protein [Lysobacteraceae bacterium]|nr:MAG: DUF3667 domain-containing protein [Xanthomonadaceae bacterium]